MKRSLTLIIFFITFSVSAQVMPSPDAASMIKGINSPVNLYNGTVSVSVPLYEATANNGAKVPVALQYNGGGGIRVAETSGVAGLGWHLMAGGSITRVMRGEPDEQAKFATALGYSTVKNYLDNKKSWDFEKDLFYFSSPGGSGRFIFEGDFYKWMNNGIETNEYLECVADQYDCQDECYDRTGNTTGCNCSDCDMPNRFEHNGGKLDYTQIITLPSSDIRIKFHYEGEFNSHWVITDTYGNQYYFGQTSGSREVTTTNVKDNKDNKEYKDENERKFISTWKLDRIVYANQPENADIKFTYVSSTITDEQESTIVPMVDYNFYYQCMENCANDTECQECETFNEKLGSSVPNNPNISYSMPEWAAASFHNTFRNTTSNFKSTISAKYLTSIRFPKGRIDFGYSDHRSDLPNGKILNTIDLKDHTGKLVSSTYLQTRYFNSRNSYFKGGKNTSCYSEKCMRLKLELIKRDGALMYEFDYTNGKQDANAAFDPYELPPRDSYYTDHWGFYNGGTHQGELYVWHPSNGSVAGMKKYATNAAKANLLGKITFPTGGYRTFTYQKHETHGGVRIDRIKDFNTDGVKVSDVNYNYHDENNSPSVSYVEDAIIKKKQDGNEYRGDPHPHLFSNSQTFTFDLNGPTNGYGQVDEINVLNGAKTEHYFKGLDERPQVYATKTLYGIDTEHNSAGYDNSVSFDIHAFPYVTNTLEFFDRGVEKKSISYDESGVKVSQVNNYYLHEPEFDFSITNRSLHMRNWDQDVNWLGKQTSMLYKYIVSEYDIKTRNVYLDRTVSKSFDEAGVLIAEVTTSYDYDDNFQTLPKEITTIKTAGGGESFNTKQTHYYGEFPTNISSMASGQQYSIFTYKNIIATPLVTETRVQYPGENSFKVTSVNATTYELSHDFLLPNKTYTLTKSNITTSYGVNDLECIATNTYNAQGLLETQVGQDGVVTRYEYDSKGYLSKKIIDPGVAALKRESSYLYYPLIGIRSVTGTDGRKVSYRYDDRNRLLMVIDNDGNILKRYRYHSLADEQLALNSSFYYSGYQGTCYPLEFRASNDGSAYYGATEITWDFGDGNQVSTDCTLTSFEGLLDKGGEDIGSSTVSNTDFDGQFARHRYTSPGTYTVTLTMTNPDYAEAHVYSRNVTIYEEKAQVILNGTNTVEYGCSSGGGNGDGFEEVHSGVATSETIDGGSSPDTPNTWFSFTFSGTGARCTGTTNQLYNFEYQKTTGTWESFGSSNNAKLPAEAFYYSSSPYTINVKGTYTDCTGESHERTHTLTVNPCNYSSGGSGGTGGTGGSGDGPVDDGGGELIDSTNNN